MILRVIVALTTVLALAGCGSTVTGTPTTESSGHNQQFEKLLHECDAVPDEKIAETVTGDAIYQYFYGAVCMWTANSPGGIVDVTFAWYENNSLGRELDVAQQLGYRTEKFSIAGSSSFYSRRPDDPNSCGVTVIYSGVITWWVQSATDPCGAAEKLAELTLNRNL